jgi:hypothetical protein
VRNCYYQRLSTEDREEISRGFCVLGRLRPIRLLQKVYSFCDKVLIGFIVTYLLSVWYI